MIESIIRTFERYSGEDHDLAVSLTARALRIDECEVRKILDA